jgi:hypothetical protein
MSFNELNAGPETGAKGVAAVASQIQKLHKDDELFDRAYGYIREYY